MGPEGGAGGGRVVAEGTPKDVAKAKDSWTGKYLKPVLKSSNTTIDRLDGEATVRKSSAAAAVKRVRATV